MKKILTIVFITTLLISCGKKTQETSLDALNKQKATLVHQLDSLTTILNDVEAKITKLDTAQKMTSVTALAVKNEIFKHYVEIQGVVQTDKNIEIHPELGGNVMAIYVKEGQQVNAGQTIMQLDDAAIQNNISEVKTQLALATTTFERQQRLWNQKIGSEIQYLQAKTQKESLEDNLASLKTQAKKMKITAPFTGVVDEIFPRVGELTSPLSPVVRLVNLNHMYVEADVPEKYINSIKKGTEAILQFEHSTTPITASVNQVSNFIDPNNRSFKIKILINNSSKKLKPNLIANLKLNDFTNANALTIPSNLIQEDQEGNSFVFKIQQQNNQSNAIKTIIKTGLSYNNITDIEAGLTTNDLIINKGSRGVKNNQSVTVVN